jgi:type IV pilus assembly protein PilB
MEEKIKKRLGEILIEDGCLIPEHLNEALIYQKKEGGLIGQILVKLGFITEDTLIAAVSKQLSIPYLPLSQYSINMEAAQSLGEEFCRKNLAIMFEQDEKRIYVALADPLNDIVIEEIRKKNKLKLQIFITTPTELNMLLDVVFKSSMRKAG